MALVNDFSIWASGGSAVYDESQNLDTNHTGYLSGEKIYARTLNGILKDVSTVTVSLLAALLSTTTADTSSMTFNNDQTLADMQTQFESLLTTRNVATASRWQTQRTINIKNGSGTILATATGVDGTANINLQFSTPVDISISGNAATATSATSATYIRKANSSPSSTTRHYLAAFDSPGTTTSSEVRVLENLTYLPNTNTLATNISGNAATSNQSSFSSEAYRVSKSSFEQVAISSARPSTSVQISGSLYTNTYPAVYIVTVVKQVQGNWQFVDKLFIKHDGSSRLAEGTPAISANGTVSYLFTLEFSTITSSSNYTATLKYSSNGGSTYYETSSEQILAIHRFILC